MVRRLVGSQVLHDDFLARIEPAVLAYLAGACGIAKPSIALGPVALTVVECARRSCRALRGGSPHVHCVDHTGTLAHREFKHTTAGSMVAQLLHTSGAGRMSTVLSAKLDLICAIPGMRVSVRVRK
jgi:hypothetical protein